MRGYRLGGRGRRSQGLGVGPWSTKSQAQNRQRELGVIARKALGLLSEQAALETLILFAKQSDQGAVFVALLLELLGAQQGELPLQKEQVALL